MTRLFAIPAAALAIVVIAPGAVAGTTVRAVERRGELICGVANDLPGFSAPDSKGQWSGLDVDVCRAVAAAIFGDASKVRYVPLTAQARLTALQTGEIDLLARNTTYTLTRDTSAGLNFTVINYYDGQAFLAPKSLGAKSALELSGATVCVQTGTTTELNLADYFRANKMELRPVTLEKVRGDDRRLCRRSLRCAERRRIGAGAIRANATPRPEEHVILPELISKEPLAPAVRQGDDQWFDIVRWSQFAMIEAEERGVGSRNVDAMLTSADPNIRRLLGVAPGVGAALGLREN
jgi:general L-amino acid transport system substrate-binding protein